MKIVNGVGRLNPSIAIVGEGAGRDEELQGQPFVGRSGQLLNKMLQEVGLNREDLYITNAIKFRPEDNRTPTDAEIRHWNYFLKTELDCINPKVILALGKTAVKALSANLWVDDGTKIDLTRERGKIYSINLNLFDYDKLTMVIPTFHPNYCLRFPKRSEVFKKDLLLAKSLSEKILRDRR